MLNFGVGMMGDRVMWPTFELLGDCLEDWEKVKGLAGENLSTSDLAEQGGDNKQTGHNFRDVTESGWTSDQHSSESANGREGTWSKRSIWVKLDNMVVK